MKNKKMVSRPAHEVEITESTTCDICKETFGGTWDRPNYSALETDVKMQTGNRYPDCGSGEEITFDICPKCFSEKLIPALAEMGAKPTISEWDY